MWFFFTLIFVNYFILSRFDYISSKVKLYDIPDFKRKIHNSKVSLIGGCIFFFNFLLFFFYSIYSENYILFFINKLSFFSFFFTMLFIFIIGFVDDIYKLRPEIKLFSLSIIFVFALTYDVNLIIDNLKFLSMDEVINLYSFSLPFSILCILLFINSLNMFDGINMQIAFYFFIVLIFFLLKGVFIPLILFIFLPLIVFSILNFKQKCFLGDSGSLLIGFIISYLVIKTYNNFPSLLKVEDIFLIMMLPGLDMFRLFLERSYKKFNPFMPDKNHIHHFYLHRIGYKKTFILIQLFILVPIATSFFFNSFYGILIGLLFYSFFLYQYFHCKIMKN